MSFFCECKAYAKVWKVTPAESGKYIDLQISTSEKNQNDEYENSNWFARIVGHALNSVKNVKEGDTILINKIKFKNEKYEDENGKTRSALRLIVSEASFANTNKQEAPAPAKNNRAVEEKESEDTPW